MASALAKTRVWLLTALLAILVVLAFSLTARAEPVVATYYGEWYVGTTTASGEPYNPYDFTAAHPYLPLGTELLVHHNGRSVLVRVNDRCSCGLDLSLAAAQAIGLTDAGTAVVDVEVLETESLPIPSTTTEGQDPEGSWPPANTASEVGVP
jgi:rare lipoprotein A